MYGSQFFVLGQSNVLIIFCMRVILGILFTVILLNSALQTCWVECLIIFMHYKQ